MKQKSIRHPLSDIKSSKNNTNGAPFTKKLCFFFFFAYCNVIILLTIWLVLCPCCLLALQSICCPYCQMFPIIIIIILTLLSVYFCIIEIRKFIKRDTELLNLSIERERAMMPKNNNIVKNNNENLSNIEEIQPYVNRKQVPKDGFIV
eukprot:TRINITY_DN8971_c0_g1_i1.p1 TRINITY_DN8971_c0_g1~~TRINITY_DN8971_c0_g1_i1.p1  ORF type:complete len:148 (+),score=2.18 TRINITY_DN8971_c0_g1_i1:261-704(+)